MLKLLQLTHAKLAELLNLPPGVVIAAARQGLSHKIAEFVIVDVNNQLPEEAVFNRTSGKWETYQEKGSTGPVKGHTDAT